MDYSLPRFFVHVILQARVLEWGAIAFSKTKDICISKSLYTYTYADIFLYTDKIFYIVNFTIEYLRIQ